MRRGFAKYSDKGPIKEGDSTETGIGFPFLLQRALQAFAIGWQSLSFVFITLLLPPALLPAGVIGSVVGISLTTAAILKGRSAWVEFSLLDAWLLFFILLISQAAAGTIGEYLPIILLQFVMVLFAVELLTAGSWYRGHSSTEPSKAADSTMSEEFLRRSVQQAFRHVSRAGLLFASCYLVSLGILYLSAIAMPTMPLLADISLYIVIVSVSLALLILLREE